MVDSDKIIVNVDLFLNVLNYFIIFYIEGDGIGVDIILVMLKVIDVVIEKVYGNKCLIVWMEIFCGEKLIKVYGLDEWMLEEILEVLCEYIIGIKGLLIMSVGGGICLLNVVLR